MIQRNTMRVLHITSSSRVAFLSTSIAVSVASIKLWSTYLRFQDCWFWTGREKHSSAGPRKFGKYGKTVAVFWEARNCQKATKCRGMEGMHAVCKLQPIERHAPCVCYNPCDSSPKEGLEKIKCLRLNTLKRHVEHINLEIESIYSVRERVIQGYLQNRVNLQRKAYPCADAITYHPMLMPATGGLPEKWRNK